MKKLMQIHEEFMDAARQPMSFGKLPIMPKETDVPILPSNKWTKKQDHISKKYEFMTINLRNEFVSELLEHEEDVGHHARIEIDETHVVVTLQTKDIKQVTELDKEYAKFADLAYKDVVYHQTTDKNTPQSIALKLDDFGSSLT